MLKYNLICIKSNFVYYGKNAMIENKFWVWICLSIVLGVYVSIKN